MTEGECRLLKKADAAAEEVAYQKGKNGQTQLLNNMAAAEGSHSPNGRRFVIDLDSLQKKCRQVSGAQFAQASADRRSNF